MRTTTLLAFILALAFLGVADSYYLAESAATDTPLICGPGMIDGCNTVAQSPYSKLFGIPLGVYGVVFYALVIILAAAALFWKARAVPRYLFVITAGGALASLVFLFIQFFLIKALCVYCVASAIISFGLIALSYVLFKRAHTIAPSQAVS